MVALHGGLMKTFSAYGMMCVLIFTAIPIVVRAQADNGQTRAEMAQESGNAWQVINMQRVEADIVGMRRQIEELQSTIQEIRSTQANGASDFLRGISNERVPSQVMLIPSRD
jgi:hypothetical protein